MSLNLRNDTVILRALEPEDLSFLYQCENNTDIWKVSNTQTPYSIYVLKQYLENSHHDIYTNKQLRLIITSVAEPDIQLGAIDLFDFDPFHMRAGIGILLNSESNRGKGIATKALQVLVEYCFKHLKLHQLFCNIGVFNEVSVKLFERAGFKQSGIRKDWQKTEKGYEDVYFYQLINAIN